MDPVNPFIYEVQQEQQPQALLHFLIHPSPLTDRLSFSNSISQSFFLSALSVLTVHLIFSLSVFLTVWDTCSSLSLQATHFQSIGGVRERGVVDSLSNGMDVTLICTLLTFLSLSLSSLLSSALVLDEDGYLFVAYPPMFMSLFNRNFLYLICLVTHSVTSLLTLLPPFIPSFPPPFLPSLHPLLSPSLLFSLSTPSFPTLPLPLFLPLCLLFFSFPLCPPQQNMVLLNRRTGLNRFILELKIFEITILLKFEW